MPRTPLSLHDEPFESLADQYRAFAERMIERLGQRAEATRFPAEVFRGWEDREDSTNALRTESAVALVLEPYGAKEGETPLALVLAPLQMFETGSVLADVLISGDLGPRFREDHEFAIVLRTGEWLVVTKHFAPDGRAIVVPFEPLYHRIIFRG